MRSKVVTIETLVMASGIEALSFANGGLAGIKARGLELRTWRFAFRVLENKTNSLHHGALLRRVEGMAGVEGRGRGRGGKGVGRG